jgi:tRNA1Val (adenine37-N6)-methyltransferase
MDDAYLLQPGPEESLDLLAGEWRIFQLKRGHRFSTDDLLCAWAGAEANPGARRLLDLGAGIGSVGLLALWGTGGDDAGAQSSLVMVEAQEVSHRLAIRTIEANRLGLRVEARFGDLRDPAVLPESGAFDLVTCSPPYIPVGRGAISPVAQRAGSRMELRGNVFDYFATAARVLAPKGRVALVFAAADPRAEAAIRASGFSVTWRRDVVFREGRPPTIALYIAAFAEEVTTDPERPTALVVRDAQGRWTGEMLSIRRKMGATAAVGDVTRERG